MPTPKPAAPRRVRDPVRHREAILEAAAQAFAERGYDRATVREIARRAGVTHGLVLRHFGSKEALFLAAVPGTREVVQLADESGQSLSTRIAQSYVRRLEDSAGTDPFIALIRSAAIDDRAAGSLYRAMEDLTSTTYGRLLNADAVEHRLPFVAGLLIGVTFSRYVVKAGALAEMSRESFTEHLAQSLDALLSTGDPVHGHDSNASRRMSDAADSSAQPSR
ncbi:TetR family transcriptional regulator [Streptomyces sp. NPDC050743]|uniref:TetR/AcrR family transcriptional regulator n=1 Tax=Streptomyces sp. NPDC050743 TaxID=3365634 RepID=UPI0037B69632